MPRRKGSDGRHGCTGECCREFPISYSYEDIMENYRAWTRGESGEKIHVDIHLIAPMLRKTRITPEGVQLYRCVHWDPESTRCGIYEIRPRMCRDYPYARECLIAGCRYGSGRRRKNAAQK